MITHQDPCVCLSDTEWEEIEAHAASLTMEEFDKCNCALCQRLWEGIHCESFHAVQP